MNLRKDILSSNEYAIKNFRRGLRGRDYILFWYKLHNEELSKEFYKCLIHGFYNILNNPKGYQKIFKGVRRCLVKKFPYSIVFRIDKINFQIDVITVFHNSRNPKFWKQRIN